MSKINVDTWEPESGTAATLMASGDTVTVPSGASLVVASGATINITDATQTGFPSAGFNSVQTFTASGTWTRPVGITKVVVEVQGAGGSGSAAGGGYANGGAAGGYAKKFVDVSSVTASVITIGTGGAAVSVTSHGNAGGDSTWVDTASGGSLTLTGAGGAAGLNANYAIAIGGTATNGDINIQGGDGYPNNGSYIQQGGGSFYGTGGSGGYTGQGVTGAARGYGAGGGGGTSVVSTAGGGGIIIVWEYK